MFFGKIDDVNIVADASAVRGVVVVSKYGDSVARNGRSKQQWDQVGLGVVFLADPGLRIGAAGVEVSRSDAAQPAVAIDPAQKALHSDIRLAVGVDGRDGSSLEDRYGVWHSVHRSRRRE